MSTKPSGETPRDTLHFSRELSRGAAEALDAADPLAAYRDLFVIDDPDLLYLDGNSLGRLPRATADRLRDAVAREWGGGLIRGWHEWIDLATDVGDQLGAGLLGAAPGQVAVCDSTTVNLYKLAAAAMTARPGRRVVVSDHDNFPTDRYVLDGVARAAGGELRLVTGDVDGGPDLDALARAIDGDVALVSLSHVSYRSGALLDMADITRRAHAAGALVLWDVAHSAGSVPVQLDACEVDLAVGCTYKYLNAGPGAPGFLYVARALQPSLVQPIHGWFGQVDQFAMGPTYQPRPDIRRFLAGTTPVLGVTAVAEGVRILAEAGIEGLRAKGSGLTDLLIQLADERLAHLGFRVASPRAASRRGSHVCLEHAEGYRIAKALIEDCGVVPDYREPDRLRLGPAPVYTRYVDVWDAVDRLHDLVVSGRHLSRSDERDRVT